MQTAPFHAGPCNGTFNIYAGDQIVKRVERQDAGYVALAILLAREDILDGEIDGAAFEDEEDDSGIGAHTDCPNKLLRAAADLLRWAAWETVQ